MEFLAILLLIVGLIQWKQLRAENAKKKDTYQETCEETRKRLQQLNSRSTQGTKPVVQSESKPELKPEPKPKPKPAAQWKGQGGHPCWTDGKGRYYLCESDGLCRKVSEINSVGQTVKAYWSSEKYGNKYWGFLPGQGSKYVDFVVSKLKQKLPWAGTVSDIPEIEDYDTMFERYVWDFEHGYKLSCDVNYENVCFEWRYEWIDDGVLVDFPTYTKVLEEIAALEYAEEKKSPLIAEESHEKTDKLTPECKGEVVRQGYCGNRHEHEGGKNLQWELYDNNVLRIWGSGNMFSVPKAEEDYGSFGEYVDYYSSPWEDGAFRDSPIEEVWIEDGVTSIGDYAFGRNGSVSDGYAVSGNHFPNLRAVRIPASVTKIGYKAFADCDKLVIYAPKGSYAEEFAKENRIPFVIVRDFTKSVDKMKKELVSELRPNDDLTLSAPAQLAEEKKDTGGGKSGACGENLRWELDAEGTLRISGNGPMKDYRLIIYDTASEEDLWFELEYGDWCAEVGSTKKHYVSPWHDAGEIRKVVFEEGVTSVGVGAFAPGAAYYGSAIRSNSYTQLVEITLPNSLEVVEHSAFSQCKKLSCVKFSAGLERIKTMAFCCCQRLASVTLPDGIQEIGMDAFMGCDNLAEVTIPASVTVIGKNAFARCPKLVIHAPKGSYAEEYAREHKIPFMTD